MDSRTKSTASTSTMTNANSATAFSLILGLVTGCDRRFTMMTSAATRMSITPANMTMGPGETRNRLITDSQRTKTTPSATPMSAGPGRYGVSAFGAVAGSVAGSGAGSGAGCGTGSGAGCGTGSGAGWGAGS